MKLFPLALSLAASLALAPTVPPIQTSTVTVQAPAAPSQRVSPSVIAARDEVQRADELRALPRLHHRQLCDGKNRSAGDRAHKRWKRRRRGGR